MWDLLIENIKQLLTNPGVILFGAVTIIQIVPIKLDPWTKLLKWIGDAINGEDRKNISEISKNLAELKRDFEENKAQEKRWHILDFANSCRNGRKHTREEWTHVISELTEYEDYTKRKNIKNGVIEEDGKYLREIYHDCNQNNTFL